MAIPASFVIEAATSTNVFDPVARMALAHWDDLRKEAPLPLWTSFDILQLPEIIPHTLLIDVIRSGDTVDFSYHMAGNYISEQYGEMTGKTLGTDEARATLSERIQERAQHAFMAAYEMQQGVVSRGDLSVDIPGKSSYETVILPFLDEDGEISNMISVHIIS